MFSRTWNFQKLFKFKRHARRKPIRRANFDLEQLEERCLFATNITQYHVDNQSTGANVTETQLTSSNVNAADFGQLYNTALDGQVYAEPLVMTNVTIVAGANTVGTPGTYNSVVFVATQGDSLYAINAASGAILWHRSFLDLSAADSLPNATSVTMCPTGTEPLNGNPAISSGDISPQVGITGTPVIDPSTNVMYINVKTMETLNSGSVYYVQRLHAINLDNGTDAATPYVIGTTAANLNGTPTNGNVNTTNISVAGTGDGNVNGVVQFNALREANRPALSLVNGTVYIEWASHGDEGPYHGWVVSWNVSKLTTQGMVLSGVLCTDPNGGEGGIWGGGGGLTWDPDEANTFYFETGNGDPRGGNPPLNAQGFPTDDDYYESLVKVVLNSSTQANPNTNGWGMSVVDYFTPSNVNALDDADEDFGSGSPLVLPDSAGIPGYPHLIVAAGKDGRIFLLNRDNLGKFNATGDNVLNSVYNANTGVYTAPTLINGSLSTPAYYHGVLYWVSGYNNNAQAYIIAPITNPTQPYDVATVEPISETANNNFGYLPGSIEVSANGDEDPQDAVVWINDTANGELHAYSALSLSTELWNSGAGSIAEVKFATPDIANGEVFVGTQNSLMAFGLTGATTPAKAPNAVSNLSASALSGSAVELTWTDGTVSPNFATNYAIQMATSASGPFSTVANAGQESTTYTVTGLSQNTTYYFQIVSSNAAGSSPPSSPVASAATTNQTGQTPTAPVGLGAVPASGSEVYLNWTNTATNATGFTITRATNNLFTQNVVTEAIASAPYYYTDFAAGLSPGNTYYYKIQASNSSGLSSSSNTASVSIPNVPPAPTNALAVQNTNQVELSWTDHAGPFALGYQISRSVDGGPYVIYADRPETSDSPPSTQTYFDTNVPIGHTYSYEIVAENVSGFSAPAYASVSILGSAALSLDNSGNLAYTVAPGAPDRVVVNLANGIYTLTDTAVIISVTGAGAGFVTGNGTSSVTIPAADVSNMTLDTGDNTDVITIDNDAVPITITADSGGGAPTINLGDPVNNSTISGTITNLSSASLTISGSGTTNVTGNLVSTGGVTIAGSGTAIVSGNVNIGSGNLTDAGSGAATVSGVVTGNAAGLPGLIEGQGAGNTYMGAPQAAYGTDIEFYPYMGETAGNDHAIVATTLHTWATNNTWIYDGQINIGNTNGTGTGTVSFAKAIDDNTSIKIDGKSVLYDTGWTNSIGTGPLTLSAGWHNIDIRFSNGGGGAGADGQNNNGWSGWTPGNANPLSGIGFVYRVDTGPNDPLGQATGGNVANYVIPTDNGTGNLFRSGGPGGVVMSGSGTLTLSGNNTFLGSTNIQAGKLVVAGNNALSPTKGEAVLVSGGTLELPSTGGVSVTAGNPITISGNGAGNGAIENPGGSNTINDPITIATGADIGSDAGLLTLTGNVTMTAPLTFIGAGNTTVTGVISGSASAGGLLETQDYGNVNTISSGNAAFGSDIVLTTFMAESNNLNDGITTPLGQTSAHTWGNNDTWIYTGQVYFAVGNTYRFYESVDDASYLAIDGNVLFNGNEGWGQTTSGIVGDGQWHNFNARFSNGGGGAGPNPGPRGFTMTTDGSTPTQNSPAPTDNGSGNLFRVTNSLTMAGSGVVTLANTNTFPAPTYITSGELVAAANGAMGPASAAGIFVNSGGTLGFSGNVNYTTAEPTYINGTGSNNNGAVDNLSGTNTVGLPITLKSPASIGSDSGTMVLSGSVSMGGDNLTFTGAGNITVTGAMISPANSPGLVEGQGAGNTYQGAPQAAYGTDIELYPYMGETAGNDHAIVATNLHTWATNDTWIYDGQINIGNTNGNGTGTVSFAKAIDDNTSVKIDGISYLYNTNWQGTIGTGTITLKAGWHNIDIRFSNGGGGAGADGQLANGWTGFTAGNANPLSGIGFVYRVDTGPNDPLGQANNGSVANYVIPTDNGSGNLFRAAPPILYKTGTGTVTVVNANMSFFSQTIINAGTLVAGNANSLGNSGQPITVNSGGSLGLTGNITLNPTAPVTIAGQGAGGNAGALENIGGNNTITQSISVPTDSSIGSAAGTLTVSGNLLNTNKAAVSNLTFYGAGNVNVTGQIGPVTTTAGALNGQYWGNLAGGLNNGSEPFTPGGSGYVLSNGVPPLVEPLTTSLAFSNLQAGGNSFSLLTTTGGTPGPVFASNNNEAAIWTGFLTVPATAGGGGANPVPITFITGSDDGSALYIDGGLVVNDLNDQGVTYRSGGFAAQGLPAGTGIVDLVPGSMHTITIEFYNGGGGSGIVADWDLSGATSATYAGGPPGASAVPIPASAFSIIPPSIGNVVKNGSGTVTLSNSNSFTGTTTINAGTLQFSSDPNLGGNASGLITINGGTLDDTTGTYTTTHNFSLNSAAATIEVDGTANLTIPTTLTGSGTLNKAGAGTLTLPNTNGYSGGTNVAAGTVVVRNTNGLGSGTVTMSGGTLSLQTATNSTSTPVQQTVAIASGFNQDVVWSWPTEISPNAGTTTGLDGPNGNVLYQAGALFAPTGTGLPANGQIQSAANSLVTFQLQSYTANNVLFAPDNNSYTMTLAASSQAQYKTLNVLDTAANGNATYSISLNYADGTSDVFNGENAPDWYTDSGAYAFNVGSNSSNGRVSRSATNSTSPGTDGSPASNPRLFEQDYAPNPSKVLDSVTFTRTGGGNLAVFALSGQTLITGTLAFPNSVAVTANSTIDVEKSPATIGPLTIGSNTLTVTQSNAGASLTMGATTLTGNPTFAPAAGATLALGALNDGGVARTIAITGGGTLSLGSNALSLVNGTLFNVGGNGTTLFAGSPTALGTLATVNLNSVAGIGGTLSLGANETVGLLTGQGPVQLNGNLLTVGSTNNLSSAPSGYNGSISDGSGVAGSGGLIKSGTGTFILKAGVGANSGTSSYTGPTTVSQGTLEVDGALSATTVTVDSGATLDGTGTVHAFTVSPGGHFHAGDSPGTLTTADFTLTSGANFDVFLQGTAAGTGYSQTVVTGGVVNLGGGTLNVELPQNGSFLPQLGQTYTIVTGAGSINGTFGQVTTSPYPEYGYSISYTGGAVVLTLNQVPGAVTHFVVTASPPSIQAGGAVGFSVSAEDANNFVVPTYTGTVTFTSSDAKAAFASSSYSFTGGGSGADNGVHTFAVGAANLFTAGSQTIDVADLSIAGSLSDSNGVMVTAGAFTQYDVSFPSGTVVVAGAPFVYAVQAADQYGNAVTSYSGPASVTVVTSPVDSQGNVPSPAPLDASGFGFELATLKTAKSYTFAATGTQGQNTYTGSASITVVPAAVSQFAFSGVPASILTGTPFSMTVTAEDRYNNPTPAYTGTVHFTSTDTRISAGSGLPANYTFPGNNASATFTNGVTLLTPGAQTVTVSDTSNSSVTSSSSAIQTAGLQVSSLVANATGFTVTFNKAFDPSSLKLYGTTLNNQGLIFASTNNQVEENPGTPQPLAGSIVPNAADTAFTFVETSFGDQNGGLPNGVYDVSLLSSANGIKDTSGVPLDASNSAAGATNLYSTLQGQAVTAYSTSFTLSIKSALTDSTQAAPTQVAVSLPAFAQGPGLPVHVQFHNTGGSGGTYLGIPATISDGNDASTVSFSITYNTSQLTVSGGVADPSITSGGYPQATFSRTTTGSPVNGIETDTFTFSTGDGSLLTAGTWTLGDIMASVPNGQPIYQSKQVLTVSNISTNGAAHGGVTSANLMGGNGFEVVTYLGDASGDGNIQLNDATLTNNVGNPLIGGGFPAYHLVDPVVLADTDGAGFVDSSTVGNIASLAIGHGQPTIPTPPSNRITTIGGPDPDLSLPSQVTVANGLVEVPVDLNDAMPTGSTGLTQATLDLTYDPQLLSVTAHDVHLGSLPSQGTGWTIASVVNQAAGQIVIQLYSLTPLTMTSAGSLVVVDFKMSGEWRVPRGENAFASPLVSLVDSANPTGQVWFQTSLSDSNGALTLGNSTGLAVILGLIPATSAAENADALVAPVLVTAAASPFEDERSLPSEHSQPSFETTTEGGNEGAAPVPAPTLAPVAALPVVAAAVNFVGLTAAPFQVAQVVSAATVLTTPVNNQHQLIDQVFRSLPGSPVNVGEQNLFETLYGLGNQAQDVLDSRLWNSDAWQPAEKVDAETQEEQPDIQVQDDAGAEGVLSVQAVDDYFARLGTDQNRNS